MALQRQAQLHRQCKYPVWAWLLLLLLIPTVLEMFNAANMIPRPWTTVLNTLLTDVSTILILLRWSAQTLAEAHSLVLLVSVTDSEAQAILTVFPSAIKTVIQNRTYYSLGRIGQTRTYMVQATGMGPIGVRTCIEDGIRALSPKAIILVGIAFGLQADRQQLGDVLVSRQIQDYDPQRYGTGPGQQPVIHLRGNRMTATEWLLDRFSAGKYDWHSPATIHIGLLLSGSLLIDHYGTRERLLHLTPEALGGEMEGATLCEVALRNHVGWIVVKAIADWADGNKQQDEQEQQRHAAENAAQFVYHVLRQPGFIQKKE